MKPAAVLALVLSLAACAPVFAPPQNRSWTVPTAQEPAETHPGLWTGEEPYSPGQYAIN